MGPRSTVGQSALLSIARLLRERDVKNPRHSFRETGQHANKCPEPNRKIWLRTT
jgi:hypothetical protein